MRRFKLIVIVGPTASGKTALAVETATHLNCEIISADSRQIYREMNIGTAKPSREEQRGIRHHMIGCTGINDYYSAGRFEKDVIRLIGQMSASQSRAIMAGGSGLYIEAVCRGIDDMPGPDFNIRDRLLRRLEEEGLENMVSELAKKDPEIHQKTDLKNPKRVLRALEVIEQADMKYSSIRKGRAKKRDFDYLKIGIETNREVLYGRINLRADNMLKQGLLQEVEQLLPFRQLTALQTVGYREFFGYFDGRYDLEEAIRLFKRNSRRYAKKQISWFKRDPEIHWICPGSIQNILPIVENFINS